MNNADETTKGAELAGRLDGLVGPAVRLGPKLFSFPNFDSWVNGAQRIWRLHGVRSQNTLCIDQRGRVCGWGEHLMIARDEGAFPVDVYLLRDDMRPNAELRREP